MMKDDKTKQAPIYLSIDQQSALPKVNIKSTLAALANEDVTQLIPLYATFLQRDLHLQSEVSNRKTQLASIPYRITSKDNATKEFLETYLEMINYNDLLQELASSIPYGFSCIDLVYALNEGIFAPFEFHLIPQRYFEYDRKTRILQFRTDSSTKIDPLSDPEKFVVHYHKTDSGELSDYGVMNKVIFTALIKHSVINSNMQYFESLGVPPVIVKIDSSSEDELKSVINQVLSLRSNAIGMFPKEAVIELLEGKASKTDFLDFMRYCDSLISHFVIGSTLSGTKDQTGSYALGVVHDDRRKDVMRLDARLLQKTIKDLLKLVLSLNMANPKAFKFEFDIGDEKDEKLLSEVYKNLSDAGFDIPPEHISKMFSIEGVTRKSDTAIPKAQNTKEKNSAQNAPFRIEDQAAAVDTKKLEKNIAGQIETILDGVDNYDDAIKVLIEAYPDFDFEMLASMLEEYSAKSTIIGAAEVLSGG